MLYSTCKQEVLRNTNNNLEPIWRKRGKNMKKAGKLFALGLTVTMLGGLLSGCGSNVEQGAGSTAAPSTGETAAAQEGAVGAVEIELFSTKAENKDTMQKLVDGFMSEHSEVKVTINCPSDAGTVLKTRLTKNDIPAVIAMGGDATYTELQGAGVLEDLSAESYIGNIQEAYLQMIYDINVDKEEKAYGIPYATNASGILYNEDLFAEAGVEVPTTWTELMDVVATLEEKGIQPFELTFKDSWTCLPPWNSMAPVIPDANFTSDRLEGKTTFVGTHEEVLEKYLEIQKHAQKDYMGTTYTDGNKMFAEGGAAMMINGNWAIPEFMNTNADLKVNMFAFPSTDDASKNTVTSGVDVLFAVSSQADEAEKAAAKQLIEYLVKAENAQKYVDEQFAFSAVKGVEQTNPTVSGVKADIANGKVSNFPDHYYPSGFDLSSILSECALNATNGMSEEENIAATLQKCDVEYDAVNVN